MKNSDQIIIIDDDEQSNVICKYIVRHALGKEADVATFTRASTGIEHIKADHLTTDTASKKVIFLDINMPQISGWEALDILNELDEPVKKQLNVYMFSSSIDPKDKKRALEHPLVQDFIEKPLSVEKVLEIVKSMEDNRAEFLSRSNS